MKISIILPCYNEEKRISRTLGMIKDYISERKEEFEIIVVNDGSKDKTVEIVKEIDSSIRIIEYGGNRGKGYAIKKGMLNATGDYAWFMDADGSADAKEFDRFLPLLEEHDIVIGSRTMENGLIKVKEGVVRRFIGFLGHKLIGLVITRDVKDLLCAFKVYNRKAYRAIFEKQISEGMASDFEVIFLAKKLGFKVKEIPIIWRHQEGGTARVGWYTKALKELLMVRVNDIFGKYK
jgi:dolichyl-phosphate beta-glucosyltransferase